MMKRLTEHIGHYVRIVGCKTLYSPKERKGSPASNAIARLADYEDAMPLELAQKLARAEKDGRLAVLPPNDPLTLEEMREMDGEPVWVKRSNGTERYYIAVSAGTGLDLYRGGCGYEGFADYGKTWFAYRRKPEEGT